MQEQIIEEFEFEDKQKQQIFETLLTKIKFPNQPYTEDDLKTDLVLRMRIPTQAYDLKSKQPKFDELFRGTPKVYEEMYQLGEEYVNYLVQKNQENQDIQNPLVRVMTSIRSVKKPFLKKRDIELDLDDPIQEGPGNAMDIECNYAFANSIDMFTLKYNMTMLILTRCCGFKVRTFIMEDDFPQQNQQRSYKCIYFLLTLSNDNLIKLANRYRIKKQINMSLIDFSINDPVDSKGRPLKINSFFKRQECHGFVSTIKRINKDLDLTTKQFAEQIKFQHELTQNQISTFQRYVQQLEYEVHRIFPSKEVTAHKSMKLILTTANYIRNLNEQLISNANIPSLESFERITDPDQTSKGTNSLQIQNLKRLSLEERKYLYSINRHKINQGCEQHMLKIKRKKYIFDKISALNKKYGYKVFEYEDCFVDFVLPNKRKPFFQKLDHMLQYQWYRVNPYGEISLFTTMERIKLAYLNIQEYFKVQNMALMGVSIFALNNQYEKFGDTSLTFNKNYNEQNNQPLKIEEKERESFLINAWHPFIPFKSNVRAIRDYMGDNFAIELSFKIHLINYMLIFCPIAIGLQVFLINYIYQHKDKQYILSFSQLVLLFFTYTFFIERWKKKQTKYFNNYLQNYEYFDGRAAYKGPYVRNILNDATNTFETRRGWRQFIRSLASHCAVVALLVLNGLCFWGIRSLIRLSYPNFPILYLISTSHLLYYSLFFLGNRICYFFILRHILNKLAYLLNLAKMSQHQQCKRKYNDYFVFGTELIGPLFLITIQNFDGSSCYSVSCLAEFQQYVIVRYILIAAYQIAVKVVSIAFFMRTSYLRLKLTEEQEQSNEIRESFQYKISKLLFHCQFQSVKEEINLSLTEDGIALFFYSIFFIHFPFCQLFSLVILLLIYVSNRLETLAIKRRPIPDSSAIYRYTPFLTAMYWVSVIVNCWSVVFVNTFMQYDFKWLYNKFVPTISPSNMLTFKLAFASILFVIFTLLTIVFKKIESLLTEQKVLQNRKMQKFKQFLLKVKGNRRNAILANIFIPLKSIFRIFAIESIIQYKKNKFNFLKQKLKSKPPAEEVAQQISLSKRKSQLDKSRSLEKTNINSLFNQIMLYPIEKEKNQQHH